ncbi:MAG: prepilin-type N-terminal cleavage/methylation domain-containing protein [Microgenomates group bacterium]
MKTNKHSLPLRGKNGFTLVELLVVMSIIGVLAALAVGSFRTAQMRGRDATRKSDLKQISNALELFYADYGRYPAASGGMISACSYNPTLGTGTSCSWGTGEFTDGKTVYFKVLPDDPTDSYSYTYEIVSGSNNQKYKLFAKLENTEDQDCLDGNCATNPNFAVTSANTSASE